MGLGRANSRPLNLRSDSQLTALWGLVRCICEIITPEQMQFTEYYNMAILCVYFQKSVVQGLIFWYFFEISTYKVYICEISKI